MAGDPIVDEIRAIRDEIAKEHGYDIRRIVQSLQERQSKSGHLTVSFPPKRLPKKPEEPKAG